MHVLQMALKAADLGHLTAEWAVHKRWVDLLEEEFFSQVQTAYRLHPATSIVSKYAIGFAAQSVQQAGGNQHL